MSEIELDEREKLRDREVEEYVGAFKASSDRARYALFVVVIATVLVAIANYNIQDWSWPRRRLATWYAMADRPPKAIFGGDPA